MALANKDRVLEKSTTTGTGTYTLAGTPGITGFNTNDYGLFSLVGDGNTVQYSAWGVDPTTGIPNNTGWETGLGTYTSAGTTLARTAVYASTNANAAVDWAAGTRFIACTPMTQGTLVVRQPGGTAGTDEVQISHDGTSAIYKDQNSTSAQHKMQSSDGSRACVNAGNFYVGDNGSAIFNSSGFKLYVGKVGFVASQVLDPFSPPDTEIGLQYVVPYVMRCTGPSDLGGWIQNTGGEARLNADYTKNNATLANTNLSLTLIASRSYRFQGYLIVSNSTAGEGAKFDFDGGTATMTEIDIAFNAVAATAPVAGTIVSTALATDLNYTTVTGTARIFVSGSCQVNAGGTFILRASEDTTATGTMTLGKGSWLAFYDTVDL